MAGIFAGSLFLIGFDWLFMVLPATAFGSDPVGISEGSSSHLLLNLLFAALFGLTTYFYSACMRFEPGFVPKMNGIAEQKAVIDELLAAWKYDEYNFCTACMIRTPLRSKHCKACQRCVAKHDQSVFPYRSAMFGSHTDMRISHCPWVYNCVGVNNHRHFFFYLISLTTGILAYDWLLYYCTSVNLQHQGIFANWWLQTFPEYLPKLQTAVTS